MSKLFKGVTAEQYDQAKEVSDRFAQDCVGRKLRVAQVALIMNLEFILRHTPLTMDEVVEATEFLEGVNTKYNNVGYMQVNKVEGKS